MRCCAPTIAHKHFLAKGAFEGASTTQHAPSVRAVMTLQAYAQAQERLWRSAAQKEADERVQA